MKSATIVKFKADTEEYNRKVKQAKTTLQQFGAGGKDVGNTIGQLDRVLGTSIGTLGKLSVAGAAVTASIKVLKDAFVTCGQNIDDYNKSMEGAKGAYEGFLSTLRTGDWGNFFTNIEKAIKNSKDLYDSLDALGTYQLASSVDYAKIDRDRAKNKLDLKQGKITQAQYNQIEKNLEAQERKLIDREKNLLTNSSMTSLVTGGVNSGIDEGLLKKFASGGLGVDTVDKAGEKLKKYQSLLEGVKNSIESNNQNILGYRNHGKNDLADELEKQNKKLEPKLKEYQKYVDLFFYLSNPDNFEKATKAYNLQSQAYQREASIYRAQTKGTKEVTTGTGGDKTKAIKLDNKSLLIGKDVIDNMAQNLGYPDGKIPPIKIPVEMEFDKSQTGFALMALQTEKLKSTAAGLQSVFSQASSSLSDFGESSKEAAVAARTFTIAAAIATLVGQFAAIPKGVEIWSWIAGTIAGTATLITTIASLKSVGSFAEGGIIPGPDTGGRDSTYAYVSPGEIILNKAQQRSVASQLTNNSLSNLNLTASIRNEDLRICLNSNSVRRGKGEYVTSRR